MNPQVRILAALGGLLSFTAAANADMTYDFTRITGNNVANVASQLQVTVNELGGGQVGFTFTNNVGIDSSISEIYFDDGSLLAQSSIVQNGTAFAGMGANPGNLPNGENVDPAFVATQEFSADAQGNPSNGVDTATDSVQIIFDLISGQDYDDVIAALTAGLALGAEDDPTGTLRIGIHVRSINDAGGEGGSDAFVNGSPPGMGVIPAAPSAILGLVGLGLVLICGMRFKAFA